MRNAFKLKSQFSGSLTTLLFYLTVEKNLYMAVCQLVAPVGNLV